MKKLTLLIIMSIAAGTTLLAQTDLSVCASKDYTLKSTAAAPATGATSYTWYEDGDLLTDKNEVSLTIPAGERAAGTYAYWRVAANAECPDGVASNTFTVRVNPLPDPPETVAATLCFGFPGQLTANALNASVAWYDTPTGGTSLYVGNVLPLPLLYNNTAVYYAETVSEHNCVSTIRTAALYTIYNCAVTGECPGFTAGTVDASTTPAACAAFYPGQIGATDYPVACVAFDAGRIGQ